MSYYTRIALFSTMLALITVGLVVFGPRGVGVVLAEWAPRGEEVAVGAAIRVAFAGPVDRRSAEASFQLRPPTPGRFVWDAQTLIFQPAQPLSPETAYEVTLAAGLRDERGRANARALGWRFRTRGPRLLALRTGEDGASEIWLVAPDGGGARQLLRAPTGIRELIVAPDGTRAVYVEPRGVTRSALLLLDLASGATRPLVDDDQASAAAPAWAPAGDFVAYERRALIDGVLGVPRIWLAQPDGTLLGPLYAGAGTESSYAPSWAPDGNRIAFVDGSSQTLTVYDFFSDQSTALAARSGERASWLPDGSALVFSSAENDPSGMSLRLRSIGLDAGAAARDLTGGSAAELTPTVSPDGMRVAFTRRAAGSPHSAIWIAPLDGGPARQVSAPGAHQDTQPHWSPDGRSLAFIRSRAGDPQRSEAVVVNVDSGAEQVALTGVVQLVWAP